MSYTFVTKDKNYLNLQETYLNSSEAMRYFANDK